jgi:hypothetical protein
VPYFFEDHNIIIIIITKKHIICTLRSSNKQANLLRVGCLYPKVLFVGRCISERRPYYTGSVVIVSSYTRRHHESTKFASDDLTNKKESKPPRISIWSSRAGWDERTDDGRPTGSTHPCEEFSFGLWSSKR